MEIVSDGSEDSEERKSALEIWFLLDQMLNTLSQLNQVLRLFIKGRLLIGSSCLLLLPGCGAQTQSLSKNVAQDLEALRTALESGQKNATDALTDPKLLGLHSDVRFRELIRQYAVTGKTTLVNDKESGQPLVISGSVLDEKRNPVAGALMNIYQTDPSGFYTPEKAMDEPHARIFAYLRSDSNGQFEFRTIRPGGYPQAVRIDGEDRKIPAHIHIDVSAENHQPRKFQLVFADDPLMQTQHWQGWARRYGHPVVSVERDKLGNSRGVCNLALTRDR